MATVKKSYVASSLPVAFSRGEPIPVDSSLVWYSLEELRAYATSSPVAYVGQILALVDEETNSATAYIIADATGTLKEVGSATLGDEKTISLNDGTLSLKNWGKQYYKWEEGKDETSGRHVLQIVDDDHPWIAGLEPKVATTTDGTLALEWYQPSSTTIEGVSSIVSTLQTSVDSLTEAIGSAEDTAETPSVYGAIAAIQAANEKNSDAIAALPETYLPLAGGTLTGALTLKDGSAAASESFVTTKIQSEIGSAGHLKRLIVENLPAESDADLDTIYMVAQKSVLNGDKYVEWMVVEVEGSRSWEKIGDTSVDLSGYATTETTDQLSQDLAAHTSDTVLHITSEERTKWDAAASKASENEAAIGALIKISQEDSEKLAALPAITAIGANLELTPEGVLNATEPDPYELPIASAEVLGGVKVGGGLTIAEGGALSVSLKEENGLRFGDEGVELAVATPSSAGALSSELFVKLSNLPENAEANTITGLVMGNDVAATIQDKNLVVPFASAALPGVVIASEEINVNETTGKMEINKLSATKLFLAEGEELILNGGNA